MTRPHVYEDSLAVAQAIEAQNRPFAVFQILADPTISDALRSAAEGVIDGTPEQLRHFIEVGQYEVDA
ncbi:ALF repeat-containing protein [Streptomyces sp. NPDC051320]|uniref:ALF repeat-containing protein n=1 Tax=Streptomyces sp. NPDC051320 TaxID=3154644 RepID=UPI00344AADC4